MGLFDDSKRFLETQLEEFLRNNPHLELQMLEEQLREQEQDTLRLIADLQRGEKRSQDEILSTAQEIKRWHSRIEKAKASGRMDLAQAAQEREAELLRQGNQLWGQMQGCKERLEQAKELQRKIQLRRQEVKTKAASAQAPRNSNKAEQRAASTAWNQSSTNSNTQTGAQGLEEQFQRWETEDELNRMKRNLGR